MSFWQWVNLLSILGGLVLVAVAAFPYSVVAVVVAAWWLRRKRY